MTKKLLMGNEAMAHAALEAGVRVVAGYPGTPSSEIVETVERLHASGAAQGIHVEWSTNEKVALELLFGASLAGARGLFTCKQMGLNVASDALMSLNYVSVRGGLVLVVADDPGPISSQTEQDTRRFASFAKVPVLDPATPEQAFDMVKAAFELSERFHTPVIVRPTTRIDHASAFFDIQDETRPAPLPSEGFQKDDSKWVIFPRRAYEAHGEINERLASIAHVYASEDAFTAFNPIEEADGAAFGILASGVSAAYTREALDIVRERVTAAGFTMPACRFMQIGTPYPFPDEAIVSFARGLTDVLVVEELDHMVEDELARWAGRTHTFLNIQGKLTGATRNRGENDVDDIALRIERFMGLSGRLRLHRSSENNSYAAMEIPAESLPARPPVLCPGCPHRGAFYAVKRALGKTPAVLCGDIGCYTLGNAKPLEAVDTCLCMGAGITMAQGFSIADPSKKAVAFVGDSTFFASGMTGLVNAAYNGHNITVMVLDNATTAMTGSQPHPGTGATLMGTRNAPLSIEEVLAANGFPRIYRADPLDKDSSVVAVKAALAHNGPSAVIFQSPCVQLIKPSAPAAINTERCTGCKKCITEIGCPAIGFDSSATGMRSGDRGQARIDPALCNGCTLCVQVCPFKAIGTPSTHGAPTRRRRGEHALPEMPVDEARRSMRRSSNEPLDANEPEKPLPADDAAEQQQGSPSPEVMPDQEPEDTRTVTLPADVTVALQPIIATSDFDSSPADEATQLAREAREEGAEPSDALASDEEDTLASDETMRLPRIGELEADEVKDDDVVGLHEEGASDDAQEDTAQDDAGEDESAEQELDSPQPHAQLDRSETNHDEAMQDPASGRAAESAESANDEEAETASADVTQAIPPVQAEDDPHMHASDETQVLPIIGDEYDYAPHQEEWGWDKGRQWGELPSNLFNAPADNYSAGHSRPEGDQDD